MQCKIGNRLRGGSGPVVWEVVASRGVPYPDLRPFTTGGPAWRPRPRDRSAG